MRHTYFSCLAAAALLLLLCPGASASCTAAGAATVTAVPNGPPTHTCELTVDCCSHDCCVCNLCISDEDVCESTKEKKWGFTGGADFKIYVVDVTLGASWETKEIMIKKKTLKCSTCAKATGWIGYQPVTKNYSQVFNCTTGTYTYAGTITTNTPTSGTTPADCPAY